MRLPRFRIWTLMIAVALVAIVFGCWMELERVWRRAEYGDRLRSYSEREKENTEQAEELKRRIPEDPDHFKHWSAYYAKQAAAAAREKRRLERLIARQPWEPDPDDEDLAGD